jgi:hypothetical protein
MTTKRQWAPAKGHLRSAAQIEALLTQLCADTRTLGNSKAQRMKKRIGGATLEPPTM